MLKAAIVDYGLGNLFSVRQGLGHAQFQATITDDPEELCRSDAVVLPGVGAFGDAMDRLSERGLDTAIKDFVASGRPVMGICLGMQLLYSGSEESPGKAGLGLLQGSLRRFPVVGRDPVPQIQWNSVRFRPDSALFAGMGESAYMYFLHSYYVTADEAPLRTGQTEYAGETYCCATESDNVCAVQFHPEKSAEQGLQILSNFYQFTKTRT